jgi:hypothetical protein
LLGGLWDAYFDVGSREDAKVRVCDAVREMMEILVEIAATDSDMSAVIDCMDDLKLVKRVAELCLPIFPAAARESQVIQRFQIYVSAVQLQTLPSWLRSGTSSAVLVNCVSSTLILAEEIERFLIKNLF